VVHTAKRVTSRVLTRRLQYVKGFFHAGLDYRTQIYQGKHWAGILTESIVTCNGADYPELSFSRAG